MKIVFLGETAQYSPKLALDLQPGENEVSDEQGALAIQYGLAVAAAPTFPAASEVEAQLEEEGPGFGFRKRK